MQRREEAVGKLTQILVLNRRHIDELDPIDSLGPSLKKTSVAIHYRIMPARGQTFGEL